MFYEYACINKFYFIKFYEYICINKFNFNNQVSKFELCSAWNKSLLIFAKGLYLNGKPSCFSVVFVKACLVKVVWYLVVVD